ncbi:MAG: Holliday junction branch migration protein RuvA [Desertifilum sp. SIO1I2]|nr:Holliday junction branch migration protein RuvA [Desertifilum sp. SIO1I2]
MISYLKGTVAEIQQNKGNRVVLLLEVNQMGYELQISKRLAQQLSEAATEMVQVYTHYQIREDQPILYGFASSAERDLFRQLVSVNGIGSQLAIALLDTLGLQDLVQAIVTGNVKQLVRTPGVGSKTAERIALELRTKLAQWRMQTGVSIPTTVALSPTLQEDVEMTLLALGYTTEEITQALQSLSQEPELSGNQDAEDWIRSAIAHLS